MGALDFGKNSIIYPASARTVKGPDVVEFLDSLIRKGDGRPTVIVLDNASIHHSIDQDTLDRWFLEHKALPFYLPPYSPELNLIEIVWKHFKYHWRRFVTWTRETIDAELAELLGGYGTISSQFLVNTLLNDADVSAPRWKREWLDPTADYCQAHHTLLETIPASALRNAANFTTALRAINRYRDDCRYR
nr:transposase [Paraburkholderia nodosa]